MTAIVTAASITSNFNGAAISCAGESDGAAIVTAAGGAGGGGAERGGGGRVNREPHTQIKIPIAHLDALSSPCWR